MCIMSTPYCVKVALLQYPLLTSNSAVRRACKIPIIPRILRKVQRGHLISAQLDVRVKCLLTIPCKGKWYEEK